MSQRIHSHVSVEGALLQDYQTQRRVCTTLTYEGRTCRNVQEYRAALAAILASGVKALPIGEPCEGFSYETGCPGHEVQP